MSYSLPSADLTGKTFSVEIGPSFDRGGSKLVVRDVVARAASGGPKDVLVLAFELGLALSEAMWDRAAIDLVASIRLGTHEPPSEHGVLYGSFGRWELRPGQPVGRPVFATPWPVSTRIEFAEIDLHEHLPGA